MYRIHFEPNGAYWCIQFLAFSFFGMNSWKTVYEPKISNRRPIKKFPTLEAAKTYVEEQGIAVKYREWSRHETKSFLDAITAHDRQEICNEQIQPIIIPQRYKLVPEGN